MKVKATRAEQLGIWVKFPIEKWTHIAVYRGKIYLDGKPIIS